MKSKSLLSAILGGAVVLSAFAGCSAAPAASSAAETSSAAASESSVSSEASSSAASSAAALDTSKEVELVLYQVGDRPAGQDAVDENFNKIAKEKLNCTVKDNWIPWSDCDNKYQILFSSGEEFDMAYAATWLNYADMAQKGAFMNLDELWPKYAPKNYAKQSKLALQEATVNGHIYAIPTLYGTYSAYGPVYRTDIMDGTGWSGKMENFEDVEAYLDIVKKTQPSMEPLDIAGSSAWDDTYFRYNGYTELRDYLWFDPTQASPKIITSYELPQVNDFLKMMARWDEKGFYSKSALSDTETTKLENGKSAMTSWNIDTMVTQSLTHPEYKWQFSNFVKHVAHLSHVQDALVIPNTSKNPERALALWDLMTTDRDVYDAFVYGIKDISYTLNDKGQYKITDTGKYSVTDLWAVFTADFHRSAEGTPDSYDTLNASFEKSIASDDSAEKFGGFVLDTTNIQTELTACDNVETQYWAPLELGYTDATTGLAEYKSKLEAAGVEKVRSEVQKQLDAYVADFCK